MPGRTGWFCRGSSGSALAMLHVPLFCKSSFSFLEGASHPEELIEARHELGLKRSRSPIATVSTASCAAHMTAQEAGIKLFIGSELSLDDGSTRRVARWPDRAGYANLCRLITLGRRRCEKGASASSRGARSASTRPGSSRCGEATAASLPTSPTRPSSGTAEGRVRRSAVRAGGAPPQRRRAAQEARLRRARRRSRSRSSPRTEVLYHSRARRPLQDVLTVHPPRRHARDRGRAAQAATTSTTCSADAFAAPVRRRRRPRSRARWRSPRAARSRSPSCAIATRRSACPTARRRRSGCAQLALDGRGGRYPEARPADGRRPARQGARAHRGARLRRLLPDDVRDRAVLPRARHPLPGARLGGELRGLLLPRHHRGRSGAHGPPLRALPVAERAEPPDIDLDIEHERREEVIQHVYAKYGRDARRDGRERHPLPAALGGARRRQGARPSGDRARSRREAAVACTATSTPTRCAQAGLDPRGAARTQHLVASRRRDPRVSRATCRSTPAASCSGTSRCTTSCRSRTRTMPDRTVIQWDKDDVEDARAVQGRPARARRAAPAPPSASICSRRHRERRAVDGDDPAGRPATYDMICAARHRRRVPDREPRADGDAAAAQAANVLRSRHRGQRSCARARSPAAWCIPTCAGATGEEPIEYPHACLEPCSRRRSACRCSRSRSCGSRSSPPTTRRARPTSCAATWPRGAARAGSSSTASASSRA